MRLALFAVVVALASASAVLLLTVPAPPRAFPIPVHVAPLTPDGPPPAWVAATKAALANERIAAIKAAQAGHPVPTFPAPPEAWLAGR